MRAVPPHSRPWPLIFSAPRCTAQPAESSRAPTPRRGGIPATCPASYLRFPLPSVFLKPKFQSQSSTKRHAVRPLFLAESLDLHVHAGREVELHQRIHGLLRRLQDIEQAL